MKKLRSGVVVRRRLSGLTRALADNKSVHETEELRVGRDSDITIARMIETYQQIKAMSATLVRLTRARV